MPCRRIRVQYEQLLEFERGRHIIGLKEAGWANRRIAHQMGRSNAAIRTVLLNSRSVDLYQSMDRILPCHNVSGRPRATADWKARLTVRSAVIAPDSSLSTIRRGPAHTPLVVIRVPLTEQRYVDDILRTVLLLFLLQYPGIVFQQDNARSHTTRVTMHCLRDSQTLPWPSRSLFNRACLGYYEKAIASTKEC
ncbi:uncharacterized protein TNCV_1050141 [Trichonephila clavipes]|nr:uncharacterized protein TNCV_1050141 [Trichonephila clavipes]